MHSTKAEREQTRARITDLAQRFGFAVEVCELTRGPREFTISISTLRGLKAQILIWPADAIIASWHGVEAPWKLSKAFGDVNTFHFRKSTDEAYSLPVFLAILERRFTQIKDGSAFQ